MTAPGPVAPPAPVPTPDDDAGWVRVHPASPWVRGWSIVAVTLFVVARDLMEDAVIGMTGGKADGGGPSDPRALLVGAAIAGGVLVVLCLLFLVSWWFTRYRIGADRIELRQGWLFRSRRQMAYDRIQAVDLQHPLLARLLGLAEVKVEAADGGDSALRLAFLTKARAVEVRREILDRASGAVTGAAPDRVRGGGDDGARAGGVPASVPAVPEQHEGQVMLRVPTGQLVASVLLSDVVLGMAAVFLLLALGTSAVLLLFPADPAEDEPTGVLAILLATSLPFLFSLAGTVWSGLNKGWGFTVRDSADGLRLRYGLTETTSQTVPPGRVQGVEIIQPTLWRPFGWHRVKVSVAGYGGGSESRDVALPVGPWEDVLRVLAVVAPDPGLDGDPRAEGRPPGEAAAGLMRQAMVGSGEEGGFRHVPRRARAWFHWFTWRRHGYTLTRTLLVVRSGWLRRTVQTLQHERVQDAVLSQGPVQRRLDVARLTVHMAGGTATIDDLDAGDLRALFEAESRHAAVSRRLADRNRWMLPEELDRFERRTAEVAETEVGRRELAAAGVVMEERGQERP